jgi:hypothetical protein
MTGALALDGLMPTPPVLPEPCQHDQERMPVIGALARLQDGYRCRGDQ